jgi:hypothetical protein
MPAPHTFICRYCGFPIHRLSDGIWSREFGDYPKACDIRRWQGSFRHEPKGFEVEVSPGLTLRVDDSLCIVLDSEEDSRGWHTITDVDQFKDLLDQAKEYQAAWEREVT